MRVVEIKDHPYEVFETGDDMTLVSSKSEPSIFHEAVGNTCDCLGFKHYRHCSHLDAIAGTEPPKPTPAAPAPKMTQVARMEQELAQRQATMRERLAKMNMQGKSIL